MKILEHTCESCHGKGWLLANNDTHGLRIERCDVCQLFDSDGTAAAIVASHAVAWESQQAKNDVSAF